jgi:hypothetical protein
MRKHFFKLILELTSHGNIIPCHERLSQLPQRTQVDPAVLMFRWVVRRDNNCRGGHGGPPLQLFAPVQNLQQRQHAAGVPEEYAICFSESSFAAVGD